MSTERLLCDSCGAPLEIPDGVSFVTCQHCLTPLKVQRNQSVHYTQKLEEIGDRTRKIDEKLDSLAKWHELEALDRKWEMDRKQYLNEDGAVPDQYDSKGMMIIGFLIAGLSLFGAMFVTWPFVVGIVLGVVIAGNSVQASDKARHYQIHERIYLKKRKMLLGETPAQG